MSEILINTFSIFFFIIIFLFSYLGYGIFFLNKIFKSNLEINLGQIGLIGIFLLINISYLSNFVIPHNYLHNIIVLIVGLILFFVNFNKFKMQDIKLVILLIFVTITFFFISKNHDDFPYYHLPFALHLFENKITIGTGLLNYGFRHHSSILFLNSLTFLPYIKYYLFNLPNYLILVFVNFILLKEIQKNYHTKSFVFYLSLIFILIVNVKFTRLSEYGTDLAGQILLIVIFLNFFKNISNKENINYIYLNAILLLITFSLKAYFILYFLLIPLTFYILKVNPFSKKNFNNRLFIFTITFFVLFFLQNFFSTGCLIYPSSLTCFGDNYFWSLSISEVERMNTWLELWAKAGATPNLKVDNAENYIKGFNWIFQWLNIYFFNKVTDFILILISINLIFYLLFRNEINVDIKTKNLLNKFIIPFLFLIIIFWFFKHPSLRYGGYFPISILIVLFVTNLYYKNRVKNKLDKNYLLKIKGILLITIIIFNFKNITRINYEFGREDQYKFTNFPLFFVKEKKYKTLKLDKKKYLNITEGYCWATPSPCSNTKINARIFNGYLFFER
tara:strand:- start:5142 stop:6824 length:1683 start_codon:yes stop_codon:yes gene_type:complete